MINAKRVVGKNLQYIRMDDGKLQVVTKRILFISQRRAGKRLWLLTQKGYSFINSCGICNKQDYER